MTSAEHTRQLSFLAEQSPQVLQDFCKLATNYLQKGPNLKIYGAAALKLSVEPEVIRSCVESLINLLLDVGKRRLTVDEFQGLAKDLGFDDETSLQTLCKFYEIERCEITQALATIGSKLPRYHNVEWRFQTEIASRCLYGRLTPVFALDLTLVDHENSNKVQHHLMQIDPTNLLHLTKELEFALQEARSQHTRRIKRTIKLC